jgi:hypothetical protein
VNGCLLSNSGPLFAALIQWLASKFPNNRNRRVLVAIRGGFSRNRGASTLEQAAEIRCTGALEAAVRPRVFAIVSPNLGEIGRGADCQRGRAAEPSSELRLIGAGRSCPFGTALVSASTASALPGLGLFFGPAFISHRADEPGRSCCSKASVRFRFFGAARNPFDCAK